MRNAARSTMTCVVILGVLYLGGATAMAQAPPAEIESMHPIDNGVFQVARIAPSKQGGPQRWGVRAHFFVKNTGGATIELRKISLGYPGSPQAGGIVQLLNDTDDDPNVDSRDVLPGESNVFTIDDGVSNRNLVFPVPNQIRIRLSFDGFADPLDFQAPMGVYTNRVLGGSYLFPAKRSDLRFGQHWSVGIHAFHRAQKFGYDFGVSRYDRSQKKWVGLKRGTTGSKNTDFLIYGKPVYAMAAGTIVKCAWSRPDNVPKQKLPGANHFVIDHGNGEFALYAHLQEGSVNPRLCPKTVAENTYGLSIPVAAGQFLGRAGNSGRSSGPHLHVHVELGANGRPFTGSASTGRPLLFRDSHNRGGVSSSSLNARPFGFNALIGQMPVDRFNLIRP